MFTKVVEASYVCGLETETNTEDRRWGWWIGLGVSSTYGQLMLIGYEVRSRWYGWAEKCSSCTLKGSLQWIISPYSLFVLRALFILLGLMFGTNLTIYSLSPGINVLPLMFSKLFTLSCIWYTPPSIFWLLSWPGKNLHLQLTRILKLEPTGVWKLQTTRAGVVQVLDLNTFESND